MDRPSLALPDHVTESVQAIMELHASHAKHSTPFQKLVNLAVSLVGRPGSLAVLTILVIGWVGGNIAARWLGHNPIDAPPFQWLELGCSFVALYMTILILITQRHDDQIGQYREQLTLQLAILSEQKSAKIIELLEEIRRDSPNLANRPDGRAEAMATPIDPKSVLKAIRDAPPQG